MNTNRYHLRPHLTSPTTRLHTPNPRHAIPPRFRIPFPKPQPIYSLDPPLHTHSPRPLFHIPAQPHPRPNNPRTHGLTIIPFDFLAQQRTHLCKLRPHNQQLNDAHLRCPDHSPPLATPGPSAQRLDPQARARDVGRDQRRRRRDVSALRGTRWRRWR